MLQFPDKLVIAFYFVFMTAIAWVFKRFVRNTSDYFRGGGEMLWWLAGAGAFTVGFSAVTFTGMAGKAFSDGPVVITIFAGNALGFLVNYFWFGATCRQTRAVTAMQVVRARFGRGSEQFFTWVQIPVGVCYAALQLFGLCVFVSAAFNVNLSFTILGTGTVVLIMALLGGSWSVMAGDFVQLLVLMPVTVVAAILSVHHVGGPAAFVGKAPHAFWHWGDSAKTPIIYLWVFTTLVQKIVSNNSMQESSRYLSVKDSRHARKAALLGFVMFLIGPAVWFIPPMCARIAIPDLKAVFPNLPKPQEAAYFAMATRALPVGMTGLVLSVIFGATMSAVDGGLNKNAGFFVKNFYQPFLRPAASERQLLVISKLATIVLGALITGTALVIANLKLLTIFEMMTYFSSLVALPVAIPLVLGLIFRRAPGWAGWSTVLVGLTSSVLVNLFLSADKVQARFGWHFNARESSDWVFLSGTAINVTVQCAWFAGATLLAGLKLPRITGTANENKALVYGNSAALHEPDRVARFFSLLETPVNFDAEEKGGGSDNAQAKVMGVLSAIYGSFILALTLLPNPPIGRAAFAFCAFVMLAIGIALYRAGTASRRRASDRHTPKEPSLPEPATNRT